MHDPFQSYSTLGAYPGITGPTSSPYAPLLGFGAQQIHPAAILAAQATNPLGISHPLLQNPLQAAVLANPLIAAALQNPFIAAGIQNPLLGFGQHNPFQSAGIGNPIFGGGFGNPGFGNPMLGGIQHLLNPAIHNPWASGLPGYQQQSPYSQLGHIGAQFGQYGLPGLAGYPLAPQTWVGQLGYGQMSGQGYGQMQGQRPFQSPWAQ